MNNKALFYFTGKCLMLDEDPEFSHKIIEAIALDSIDYLKFATFCSNHLILPLIYLKFQSHGILQYLPEEFAAYLKEVYELNFSRNKQILIQLEEITTILNSRKISPVFLKGSANLLDNLYSDIGERILGDIDILVPDNDYLSSVRLLESEGYSVSIPIRYYDIQKLKHYPPISKQGRPAYVEIHRLLTANNLSWFNPSTIDRDKQPVIALPGCYVFSDHHKIIHNFVHSQLQHDGHITGIVSFRDLYDFYLLSKRSSVSETLSDIRSKQKAIAYFVFAGKAFDLDGRFYAKINFPAWIFLKKHNLNQSSPAFYCTYRSIAFLYDRILIKYVGQLIKACYNKEVRASLFLRLADRSWYRAHFSLYTRFFANKRQSEGLTINPAKKPNN